MVNKKYYIGWHATNNLNDGYVGSGLLLSRSLKKYGAENFITGVLEFSSKRKILKREIYWIKKMNSRSPNGYNLTGGGDGGNNYKFLSEEKKKKIRENTSRTHKGKIVSEETRKKISQSNLGRSRNLGLKRSEETKNKLRKAWETRAPMTEVTRAKIGKASLGRKHSSETKQKIGEANSRRIWKEESRQKISKKNKGLKRSKETIAKMKKKHECKHCGKEMNRSNLTRYHSDNCKFKN